jgi:LacI family transcriptional regulator
MTDETAKSDRHFALTLADVAEKAGVSRATVSLVLRDSPLVARATRERVEAAVEQLGYIYNRGAANLRATRTKTVGLLIPNLANPFFAEMTAGMDDALDAAGYVAFVASTDESLDRQDRFLKRMREQRVDGVILCPAVGTTAQLLRQLREWQMPFVQSLRFVSERDGDYAGSDYFLGLEQVTEHLIRLGHRRVAFIGAERSDSAMTERQAGFAAAMRRHGLPADVVLKIPLTRRAGAEAVDTLLAGAQPPTAAVCFNDIVALGLIVGLQRRGLVAGKDFAVTGVDDLPDAAVNHPPLTTVATSPRQVGEASIKLLLQRIADPRHESERIILPTRLVVRQSCGALRAAGPPLSAPPETLA